MLLCVDIGNDHTQLGLLDRGRVVDHWRVASDERRTADEWEVLVGGLLAGAAADPVDGVAVAATVPAVLREWRTMLARYLPDVPLVVVEAGVRTGLPVLLDNAREVGADRVVNALAAAALLGGPVLVVSLGTATTVDVVDARGRFVGGAIAPGLGVSLDALGSRGAQLRRVEVTRPRSVVARNTVEAIQSGVVFGTAAQVDGLVDRMLAELGLDPEGVRVVATGALAPVVVAESARVTDHEPWLTLRGLELVFARNPPATPPPASPPRTR